MDDNWDNTPEGMFSSTSDLLEGLVERYQKCSKTTVVEEKTADRAVLTFDWADQVKAMSNELLSEPLPFNPKAVNRRLLIEVAHYQGSYAFRLRTFKIAE